MVDIWNLHSIQFIKGWAQKKMGLKKSASLVCFALLFNLMKHLLRNLYPYTSKEGRNASRSKGHNCNWKPIYSFFRHKMQYNIVLLTILFKTWAPVLWTLGFVSNPARFIGSLTAQWHKCSFFALLYCFFKLSESIKAGPQIASLPCRHSKAMFFEEDCVMSQGLSVSVEGFQRVTSLLLCDSAFFHFLWSLVFCSRNLHVKWNWEKRFIWSMLLEKYYLHICLGYTSSSTEFLILIFFFLLTALFLHHHALCFSFPKVSLWNSGT